MRGLRTANGNHRNLKKAKWKVLHLSLGNPKYRYRLVKEWIERSLEENSGLPVDGKLNIIYDNGPDKQKNPGLHQKEHGQLVTEVMLSFYSALVRPPPEVLSPVLDISTQEGHGLVVEDPEEGYKDDQRAGTV